MFKVSYFIFIAMAVWTAGLLFWTSQSVQQAQRELREIKKTSYGELEMVRVLSSEWDYLNRPERLERLAKSYLTIDSAGVGDTKLLSSSALIKDAVPPVVPKSKPLSKFQLVSQKNLGSAEVFQDSAAVISKPEQENFNSFIDSLSEEVE